MKDKDLDKFIKLSYIFAIDHIGDSDFHTSEDAKFVVNFIKKNFPKEFKKIEDEFST